MAILLSIETSTKSCSVALHEDGELLSFKENLQPQSTASQLAPMIRELFQSSNTRQSDLKGVIVSAGPGSYTGLRIGVATAKGICFALNIPLISINTLEVMAYQQKKAHTSPSPFESGLGGEVLLCPMLDARRMEVYCLLADANLKIIEATHAKVIDETSFSEQLQNHQIFFFGDGAQKCASVLLHPNAKFISGITPLASALGELGFNKWKDQSFEDLGLFEPFYLKDFLIKKPNLV